MKTFIIAEAGVNHNGDLDTALKMVDVAKEAGVDAIKFQTVNLDKFITQYAKKAAYQVESTHNSESQMDMLKRLQLSNWEIEEVVKHCEEKKIEYLSTANDEDSIDFLADKQTKWKISSSSITDYPLLKKIASFRQPILLSTGMADMFEIEEAIYVLKENGADDITLLQCTTDYPAKVEDTNLRAMELFKDKFATKVGYSDHTEGIIVPLAAVALGATLIEKHFTLNRAMVGPDHKASIEPHELKEMVRQIRIIETALGEYEKNPTYTEMKNREVARKSIVARTKIKKGDIFSEHNLICKRPGTGISPMKWNSVIGKIATRDYEMDELIEL